MKIRLIEEYNPVTDKTYYEIRRFTWFPPMWLYVYGDRDIADVRVVFERLKKTKAVRKVTRVLEKATLRGAR